GYREGIEAPFISCDDRAAAELAVSHLVALGHQRIGLISGPERFLPVQRKIEGFRATMRRLLGATDEQLRASISLSLFGVEGGAGCSGQPMCSSGHTNRALYTAWRAVPRRPGG